MSEWKTLTLADVGDIVSGGTPSTKNPKFWNGDIPWITPADLSGYREKYISKGEKLITKHGLEESSAKMMPEGSVLFSSRAPIGYVAIAKNSVCTNQGFKSVIPKKDLMNSDYLYYYLKYAKHLADELASGTTFKEISGKNFAKIEIPVPSIKTQQNIVKKIETLFSEIDSGTQELQTAKQKLELYKQSVLNSSYVGEETILEVVLDDERGIFDGPFGSNLKTSDYTDDGVRVIRLENIGRLEFLDEKTFISKAKYKLLFKHTVKSGDLVFSSFVADFVRACIIPPYIEFAINKADCFCIRPNTTKVLSEFLLFQFASREYFNSLVGEVRGITRPRVNTKILRRSTVRVPSLSRQREIIETVSNSLKAIMEYSKELEVRVSTIQTLKQSILKSAFEGKLI